MHTPLSTGLIYGSTREERLCDTVADWVAGEVAKDDRFAVEVIDPLQADEAAMRGQIAASEAFIVVTPEYNHSFPASLKALIDSAQKEWHAKPVGFVSYGGISGGLRAVEHLRGVLAELHAVGLRDTVSFADAWNRFDGAGKIVDGERSARSLAAMLARLDWWGEALRNARAERAYGEPA